MTRDNPPALRASDATYHAALEKHADLLRQVTDLAAQQRGLPTGGFERRNYEHMGRDVQGQADRLGGWLAEQRAIRAREESTRLGVSDPKEVAAHLGDLLARLCQRHGLILSAYDTAIVNRGRGYRPKQQGAA